MTREKQFKNAFTELFMQFYNDFDPDEYEEVLSEVDFESLAQAVMSQMETVYCFTANAEYELALRYRSKPLLPQRACLLLTEVEALVSSSIKEAYHSELWITEQFEFILIHSFTTKYPDCESDYITTYRTIQKNNPAYEDCPFSLEDLADDLVKLLSLTLDYKIPIYEV